MKWTELYFEIEIISGIVGALLVLLYCIFITIPHIKYKRKIKSRKKK